MLGASPPVGASPARAARSAASSHSSSVQPRVSRRTATSGAPPVASCSTSASMPSIPWSTSRAMWPSPRNSRSRVWACHRRLERRLRPGQVGVPGEQGASLGALAGPAAPPGGPVRRPRAHVVGVGGVGPSIRRSAAPATSVRALEDGGRGDAVPHPVHRLVDEGRAEVEEGGDHRAGVDRRPSGPSARRSSRTDPRGPGARRRRPPRGRSRPCRAAARGSARSSGR